MSVNAVSAQPARLLRNGVPIAELNDFSGPSIQANVIETTSHNDEWATFVTGVLRMGEITLNINYVPGDSTHQGLRDAIISHARDLFTIEFADGEQWLCSGLTTNFEPSLPVDDKQTADVTIQPVGEPDFID